MSKASKRVSRDIAAIAAMSLAELRIEWERRYGTPPRHRAVDLIRRVLAWRIQADVHGGLDASTRRMLDKEDGEVKLSATTTCRAARFPRRSYQATNPTPVNIDRHRQ